MVRAITIEELEEARTRYAEDIRKLEEAGPNPKYRITVRTDISPHRNLGTAA
jgi:hypothetical protein